MKYTVASSNKCLNIIHVFVFSFHAIPLLNTHEVILNESLAVISDEIPVFVISLSCPVYE